MKQVIEDFANIAAGIVGGVIQSIPETGTQQYWIMLGALLVLLGLLMVWLLVRLRRTRLAKRADATFVSEVTFDDISAEAAAGSPRGMPLIAAAAEAEEAPAASAPENEPVSGFRFFKKKSKDANPPSEAAGQSRSAEEIDDDIYLLGLEQEMLATRQLYLDGLITKEVYVAETRALYDKAQSRMT